MDHTVKCPAIEVKIVMNNAPSDFQNTVYSDVFDPLEAFFIAGLIILFAGPLAVLALKLLKPRLMSWKACLWLSAGVAALGYVVLHMTFEVGANSG